MNVHNRSLSGYYNVLTWPEKLGLWGSLASLIGLAFAAPQLYASLRTAITHSSPDGANALSYTIDVFKRDWVYLHAPDDVNPSALSEQYDHVPSLVIVRITAQNVNPSLYLELAPFIPIELINVEPFPAEVVGVSAVGFGEGGYIRTFHASLAPEDPRYVGAPIAKRVNGETVFPVIDFFKLAPGEKEFFELYFWNVPGYIYTFRLGLRYSVAGRDFLAWADDTIRSGYPNRKIQIFQFDSHDLLHAESGQTTDIRALRADEGEPHSYWLEPVIAHPIAYVNELYARKEHDLIDARFDSGFHFPLIPE